MRSSPINQRPPPLCRITSIAGTYGLLLPESGTDYPFADHLNLQDVVACGANVSTTTHNPLVRAATPPDLDPQNGNYYSLTYRYVLASGYCYSYYFVSLPISLRLISLPHAT